MMDQPILTDATLEAMLTRRAGTGAPADLAASIATALAATSEARRPWSSVLVPPAGRSAAFRLAWIVALMGLLLAATASAIWVGSELLRRTDELTVVPAPIAELTVSVSTEEVSAVAWSPDGTRLAACSSTIEVINSETEAFIGVVRVLDVATGEQLIALEQRARRLLEVAYSPDGTRLATGLAIYDAVTGEELVGGLPARFLAYSPDGTRIAVGGAWGWAAILDATTGEEQIALPLSPSWVYSAAWSPDGTRLATTWGVSAKVWDATTGDELLTLNGLTKVTDVGWSPDGTRILTTSGVGINRVWDATTGDKLLTLPKGLVMATDLAWSPGGSRIATADRFGRVARIWDATTGNELATLTGHAGEVTDVAWSPDGTRIATASADGTVRIWRVSPTVVPAPSAAPSPTIPPVALEPIGGRR